MVYKIIQIYINAFHRSFESFMTSIHTCTGKTQSSITNNLSQTLIKVHTPKMIYIYIYIAEDFIPFK